MTLRLNLVNLAWEGVSGSSSYDILLDGTKVAQAGPRARSTKINIPEGAEHKVTIKAQPSGQVQEAKFEWSSVVEVPPPPSGDLSPLGFLRYAGKTLMSSAGAYGCRVQSRHAYEGRPDPSFVYSDPWTAVVGMDYAGVDYATAHANNWTLRDSGGNEIYISAFNSYLVDVANASYRTAWKNAVIGWCQTYGYQGVMMDNVITYKNSSNPTYPAAYPNDAAIKAQQLAWNQYMAPILRGAGLEIMGNANAYDGTAGAQDWTTTAAWYAEVGPYLDWIQHEYWMTSQQNCAPNPDPDCLRRAGTAWYQRWVEQQSLIATIYSVGCKPFALTRGTTLRQQGYATASFLLSVDMTRGGVMTWCPGNSYISDTDPWDSLHAAVITLGSPAGAYTTSGNVRTRQFENGVVNVDPVAGTWRIGSMT